MIDKETLIWNLGIIKEKYKEIGSVAFYEGVSCALRDVIDLIHEQKEEFEWINEDIVPVGYDYILLSFANFSNPVIGRYEEDEDGGGAYYIGDEDESCSSQELFVNAWMPLPEPYKE